MDPYEIQGKNLPERGKELPRTSASQEHGESGTKDIQSQRSGNLKLNATAIIDGDRASRV